jgi:hypothetical protein
LLHVPSTPPVAKRYHLGLQHQGDATGTRSPTIPPTLTTDRTIHSTITVRIEAMKELTIMPMRDGFDSRQIHQPTTFRPKGIR